MTLGDALNGGQIFFARGFRDIRRFRGFLAVAHFGLPIGRFITSTSRASSASISALDRISQEIAASFPHSAPSHLRQHPGKSQASFGPRKPGSRRSRPLVRSGVSEQVQIRMIRALVRLGRTGRGAAITGFGRVTVGLCHRYSSLLLSSIYDMVRGEKCVPFTLPTGCSGRSNHNILSKAKTGSRFLSAGSRSF